MKNYENMTIRLCKEFENLNLSNKKLLNAWFDFSFAEKIWLERYNKMIKSWKNISQNIISQIEKEKIISQTTNQKLFVKTTQKLENDLKIWLEKLKVLELSK